MSSTAPTQTSIFWILYIIFLILELVGIILIGSIIAKGPDSSDKTILWILFALSIFFFALANYMIRSNTIWAGILLLFQLAMYIGIFYLANDKGFIYTSELRGMYIGAIVAIVLGWLESFAVLANSHYYGTK